MRKIAYNKCFGGFSLSKTAIEWMIKHTDDIELSKQLGEDYSCEYYFRAEKHRCHPLLIQCIEAIGSQADGFCAELAIHEIQDSELYRIDEYDGSESVETQSSYEWY